MAAIARRILAAAPPRFALAGLSMGGYIAFEIMRQAPERVAKLALLDTGARADTPEQTERRQVADRDGHERPLRGNSRNWPFRFTCIATGMATRRSSASCAPWPRKPALDAYLRQQQAIIEPAGFASRSRARSPARRWCSSARATRRRRRNWPARWPPAFPDRAWSLIPDSGHLSTLEQPACGDQSAGRMDAVMKRHDGMAPAPDCANRCAVSASDVPAVLRP